MFFFSNFIYFRLCFKGFSLVSASWGYSLAAVRGLLFAVASLAAESAGSGASGLQLLQQVSSIVQVPGL